MIWTFKILQGILPDFIFKAGIYLVLAASNHAWIQYSTQPDSVTPSTSQFIFTTIIGKKMTIGFLNCVCFCSLGSRDSSPYACFLIWLFPVCLCLSSFFPVCKSILMWPDPAQCSAKQDMLISWFSAAPCLPLLRLSFRDTFFFALDQKFRITQKCILSL